MSSIPQVRLEACNAAPVRNGGEYVLYWMIAARRLHWNFALDRAVEWCEKLRKPLVILEALRCDFPWATERTRRFVLEGMADNAQARLPASALYYPYAESVPGEGKGLLPALAEEAAVIVTDEFPCFFLPKMVTAAARKMPVLLEQVDSNGLLPLPAAPKDFSTAHSFRRFLQKDLPAHLLNFPKEDALAGAKLPRGKPLSKELTSRWPVFRARPGYNPEDPEELRGGSNAARKRLQSFLRRRLDAYEENRNDPDRDGSSGLSPYLHFGHISAHEIFSALARREGWKPSRLSLRSNGSRAGWWGMSPSAEAFLDQLVTWRELGFNFCHHRSDYDRFESLPAWAQKTLREHARDRRTHKYTLEEFDAAKTHDPLWNAAQTQLIVEGKIQNYMRMLWGKKILEWTRSPQEALAIMIELNNRYALDGRDPNSYSGILWCLGRYDRPWGPERPIFGTVRYMSSANTARKLHVKAYLLKYAQA
jgi:deoxyribodipyrimidine photo-lyase